MSLFTIDKILEKEEKKTHTFSDEEHVPQNSYTMCHKEFRRMPVLHRLDDDVDKRLHATSPNKKKRILFTRMQISELERVFRKQAYLNSSERNKMAEQIKLTPTQIKIWFQNRRYKNKKLMKDYVQDAERKFMKKMYPYSTPSSKYYECCKIHGIPTGIPYNSASLTSRGSEVNCCIHHGHSSVYPPRCYCQ